MRKEIRRLVMILCLVIGPTVSQVCYAPPAGANPPGGGNPPAGAGCWPPPCIPVDGGLVFMIAAGALYGGKKIWSQVKG